MRYVCACEIIEDLAWRLGLMAKEIMLFPGCDESTCAKCEQMVRINHD